MRRLLVIPGETLREEMAEEPELWGEREAGVSSLEPGAARHRARVTQAGRVGRWGKMSEG